jgi:UDP:flavonoid glycosyltransferase YjiC (YdhE family)
MRVLLSTIGTIGDILPMARCASALVARGCDVTVHSWEQFRAWVPAGAHFVPAATGLDARELLAVFESALRAPTIPDQVRVFARGFYRGARDYYLRAKDAFAGHDAALIGCLDHIGYVAARELEIPALIYRSHPLVDHDLADRVFADHDDELRRVLAEATGVDRRVRLWREESPLATLVACSRALADQPRASRVLLTGAWLEPARSETIASELEQFLAAGPALLATFGTLPDATGRTAALVDACARTGWRAIIQVLPPALPPARVPDGVLIVQGRLPFAALFPRVAAVVHHGSVGTLHEVARAGRPHLVIPHMGDQFFWGDMVAARGVAPAPVAYTDLAPLADRLAELRDARYTARAGELAPRIAGEDGVAYSVRHLEAAPAGGVA